MHWWVSELLEKDPVFLISQVFWVIFSICLHELGHGWMAIRLGDDTPIRTGHMTWNPLVHMGPVSLIMFALTGITWGLMPISPWKLRGRHGDAAVSFAGPAVNLILAGVCLVVLGAWIHYGRNASDQTYTNVWKFFTLGCSLNIFLMVFNLLPVPPLDGSRIAASFIPEYRRLTEHPNAGIAGIVFLGIVCSQLSTPLSSWVVPNVIHAGGWIAGKMP